MGTVIVATLQRGKGGTSPFPVSIQADAKRPHVIEADQTAREAIEEFRRMPYMTCFQIIGQTTYRLGVDVTIAGQVWTPEGASSDFQLKSEKNQPSGYVGLNVDGFIDPQYIKSIYASDFFVVADETERFALVALTGDIAHQLDNNNVYIKKNNNTPPTVDGDWADITVASTVSSVNGQVGAVVIDIVGLLAFGTNQTEFDAAVAAAPAVGQLDSQVATNTADIIDIYNLIAGLSGGIASIELYDSGTQYAIDNVVIYNPGTGRVNLYRCTVTPPLGTAPTDTNYWQIVGDFFTQDEITAFLTDKADLVGGKVPLSQLPDNIVNLYYVVADQGERNTLAGSLTNDELVIVMEAQSTEVPKGGIGQYVYKPGDPNADGTGYVFLGAASNEPDHNYGIIYLDISNGDDNWVGTEKNPVKTAQHAVDIYEATGYIIRSVTPGDLGTITIPTATIQGTVLTIEGFNRNNEGDIGAEIQTSIQVLNVTDNRIVLKDITVLSAINITQTGTNKVYIQAIRSSVANLTETIAAAGNTSLELFQFSKFTPQGIITTPINVIDGSKIFLGNACTLTDVRIGLLCILFTALPYVKVIKTLTVEVGSVYIYTGSNLTIDTQFTHTGATFVNKDLLTVTGNETLITGQFATAGGHVIQDSGANKPQRGNLNIIGATVEDDPGNDATKVTIPVDPPEVKQTLNVTNANATDALALSADTTVVEVTLSVALTEDWVPSAITGIVKSRIYTFNILKKSENGIDMVSTTNARFPESISTPTDGIDPFVNLIDVGSADGEAVVTAYGRDDGDIIFTELVF